MKQDPIAPQDQADHELGLEIIRVLGLKRKRDNGRIETTHGDKNPCGLARTVRQLSAGPLEQAAPDLLELVTLALPYVEEGEEFNHPAKRTLSKRIKAALHKATA
jgi:hypothetical protein